MFIVSYIMFTTGDSFNTSNTTKFVNVNLETRILGGKVQHMSEAVHRFHTNQKLPFHTQMKRISLKPDTNSKIKSDDKLSLIKHWCYITNGRRKGLLFMIDVKQVSCKRVIIVLIAMKSCFCISCNLLVLIDYNKSSVLKPHKRQLTITSNNVPRY